MGYRSEVRCLIYGSKDNLDAYLAEKMYIDNEVSIIFRPGDNGGFKNSLTRYTIPDKISEQDGSETTETLHVLDLYGDSWKWYEGYEDVTAWEAFMRGAPEAGLEYEFIRIGEDVADIEQEASDNAAYYLSLHTYSSMEEEMPEKSGTIPLPF